MKQMGLQTLNRQKKLADWTERVSSCRNSGLSVNRWCRENGICPQTYYHWQKKVYEQYSSGTEFYEVEPPVKSDAVVATIRSGELSADIFSAADPDMVTAICKALKSC